MPDCSLDSMVLGREDTGCDLRADIGEGEKWEASAGGLLCAAVRIAIEVVEAAREFEGGQGGDMDLEALGAGHEDRVGWHRRGMVGAGQGVAADGDLGIGGADRKFEGFLSRFAVHAGDELNLGYTGGLLSDDFEVDDGAAARGDGARRERKMGVVIAELKRRGSAPSGREGERQLGFAGFGSAVENGDGDGEVIARGGEPGPAALNEQRRADEDRGLLGAK